MSIRPKGLRLNASVTQRLGLDEPAGQQELVETGFPVPLRRVLPVQPARKRGRGVLAAQVEPPRPARGREDVERLALNSSIPAGVVRST
ncbi:MAG: hypothetical protein U0835_18685 [Isosphaeraceae bacterium]